MRKSTIAGLTGVVLYAVTLFFSVRHPQMAAITPSPTPTATPSPSPTPQPLSIAALRDHALTPGSITVTQTLPARGGCTTQIVTFTSDGLREYALLNTPTTTKPATGFPVIIFAHGYIDPKTYQTAGNDYQSFINSYCAAGYVVLKPDYRGNGTSAGTPASWEYDPGYDYDLLNLTASLGSLSAVNAQSVAWVGHSLGGLIVLRAGVASHNLPVKAIITASGPVGTLEDLFYHWSTPLHADIIPAFNALIAQHGSPQSNPTFWHDASAINYVAGLAAPIQIDHGNADTVVPVAFSQALDLALTAAHKDHQLIIYAGGDHQYASSTVRTSFLKNSIDFLNAHVR